MATPKKTSRPFTNRLAGLFILVLTTSACGSPQNNEEQSESTFLSQFQDEDPFSFLGNRSDFPPLYSRSTNGYLPQQRDPRETVIIDNSFVVDPGEVATFENKIVKIQTEVTGDILVYGTLNILNSVVIWQQTAHQQARLRVKNGGRLNVTHSYVFSGNKFWVNWEYESGSMIRLDSFVGSPWTTISGTVDYEAKNHSTVKVTFFENVSGTMFRAEKAHHVWLEIFPPENSKIDLSLPEKRKWTDWNLASIWPNTAVSVSESFLYERDVSISSGSDVTIRDTPSGIMMGWIIKNDQYGAPRIYCELNGLGDPLNDDGVLYDYKVWDLTSCNGSKLTLIGTKLERVWPTFWGQVSLTVRNSNLVDTRVFGPDATYQIYDSTLDILEVTNGARAYIENSQVRRDIDVKGAGAEISAYGVTERDLGAFSILESNGGVFSVQQNPGAPF